MALGETPITATIPTEQPAGVPGQPAAGAQPDVGGGAAQLAAPPKPPAAPAAKTLADGDEVEEAGEYKVTGADFKRRLERGNAAFLRKKFGTDNPDDIAAKLQKLSEVEAREEEARRSSLAESERLKEDLARETEARKKSDAKVAELRSKVVVSAETQRLARLAGKHIDPAMTKYAVMELAEHLNRTMTPKQIDKLGDKDLEGFFAKLVKQNPRFARARGATLATPPAAPRVPASNTAQPGASKGAAPPPAGQATVKTAKPGQPNSMTKDELRKAYPGQVTW